MHELGELQLTISCFIATFEHQLNLSQSRILLWCNSSEFIMELLDGTETFAICVKYSERFHQIEILLASQVHPRRLQFSGLCEHIHELINNK